jgi:hypothetical protein
MGWTIGAAGEMMARDLRSLIPLLTLLHGGTTVRCAAWPESICSHGEQYAPLPFMLVLGGEERPSAWKRVQCHDTIRDEAGL